MSISIGGVRLPRGIMLAPMAGVADTTFRKICRTLGAEYTVTEMISARALCYEQIGRRHRGGYKTAQLAQITPEETPCAAQIFGSEPEIMAEAAAMLSTGEYRGYGGWELPCAIDINMGCPVRKVVSNNEGCALMRDPELAGRIIEAVCRATRLPVTVKMRAGWSPDEINAPELAKIAEASGAAALCFHARTRTQMYAPGANWGIIKKVKEAVSIPVFGNGDIYSAADVLRMFRETGCDGVAVARGALGNPWIFSEIAAALEGREYRPPDITERLNLALRHAEEIVDRLGGSTGLAVARSHLAWYVKGEPGAAAARAAIMRAKSLDEVREILKGLL